MKIDSACSIASLVLICHAASWFSHALEPYPCRRTRSHRTARRYRFPISATTAMCVSHRFAYCVLRCTCSVTNAKTSLCSLSLSLYVCTYVFTMRARMRMKGREAWCATCMYACMHACACVHAPAIDRASISHDFANRYPTLQRDSRTTSHAIITR